MDGFPSGQRGQTVNLLATLSVVRIHLHPFCRSGGTGRRTGLKILRDLYSRTGSIPVAGIIKHQIEYVRLAQLDRAFGYGPKGREFESSRPRLKIKALRENLGVLF